MAITQQRAEELQALADHLYSVARSYKQISVSLRNLRKPQQADAMLSKAFRCQDIGARAVNRAAHAA